MARSWSLRAQVALERPPEPVAAHCPRHPKRRTCIRLVAYWSDGRPIYGAWWCLVCAGCPRCGAHQVWEQAEEQDDGLARDPLMVDGRPIKGDWWCGPCGEWLAKWIEYRRQLRRWRRGLAAIAEGGPRDVRGADGRYMSGGGQAA